MTPPLSYANRAVTGGAGGAGVGGAGGAAVNQGGAGNQARFVHHDASRVLLHRASRTAYPARTRPSCILHPADGCRYVTFCVQATGGGGGAGVGGAGGAAMGSALQQAQQKAQQAMGQQCVPLSRRLRACLLPPARACASVSHVPCLSHSTHSVYCFWRAGSLAEAAALASAVLVVRP